MIEKFWEFSDHIAMPNGTTLSLGYVDMTTSYFKDWKIGGLDLWVVITCNTKAGGGTSVAGSVRVHTGTDVKDGTALITGRAIPLANLVADATKSNWFIFAVPLSACLLMIKDSEYLGSTWRYFGPVIETVGDMSPCYVDSWVNVGRPAIPQAMVVDSNI